MKKRNTTSVIRKGPLSKENMKFIEDFCHQMDDIDLASRLNRSIKQVSKYKNEFLAKAPRIIAKRSAVEEARRELHSGAFYSTIKQQFTSNEIIYYENSFIDYRLQMKDMTPVEMKQLHQLITLDIFMFRHNQDRKSVQEEIDRLEKILEQEHKRDYNVLTNDEKSYIIHCETQLAAYKSTTTGKTREFKDLLDKHTDILKSLKSTRDQRIKSLDDRGKFISLLHELEISSRRKDIGEMTALNQMAVEKEKERLSGLYSFDDQMIDQPLLTADSNDSSVE